MPPALEPFDSGYTSEIVTCADDFDSDLEVRPVKRRRRIATAVTPGSLVYPRSAHEFWQPPLPPLTDYQVVNELLKELSNSGQCSEAVVSRDIVLDEFSIYCSDQGMHALELVSLDRLTSDRFPVFCVDGVVSWQGHRYYIRGAPFSLLSIDGYGDHDAIDLRSQIYIRTKAAAKLSQHMWFRLDRPASEYERFHKPFIWLARFCKHFVDFLLDAEDRTVTLERFRRLFHRWLCSQYKREEVLSWMQEAGRRDFRQHVVAHGDFLWKECAGLDEPRLLEQPLWTEIAGGPRGLTAIPEQPAVQSKTVVTPFGLDCFSHMYFNKVLEMRQITDVELEVEIEERKAILGLTPRTFRPRPFQPHVVPAIVQGPIEQGDVIALPAEDDGHWRSTAAIWYAYVQDVLSSPQDTRLEIIWLYHPSDTTLGAAKYPFANELFMSDNCGCDRSRKPDAIDLDRVLGKVSVTWHPPDPAAVSASFFVRQKYRTNDDAHDFVLLRSSDFRCDCGQPRPSQMDECRQRYEVGDTVLIRNNNTSIRRLEPAQILGFDYENERIKLRRFRRRIEDEQTRHDRTRPNEVIPEAEESRCLPRQIFRLCQIRTFADRKVIAPYDRDGAGDLFFVLPSPTETAYKSIPPWKEGWLPSESPANPRLVGLGLFCGGGAFDHGLEDGGAVKFRHAVDWNSSALHTYRANSPDPVTFFSGSVNDYLARALAGGDKFVARPGSCNVCAAGCPCQAFSLLQTNTLSEQSLRNASMVASVVSFVDLYAPEYFFLENVISMCGGLGPGKNEKIFQQIMAALVALGYQVQTFLMESWCYASCQSRGRVFIVASAPGLAPIDTPAHSHPHRLEQASALALGKLTNGLAFGERLSGPTPFTLRTASQAVSDLPDIGEGLVRICPRYPDHRLPADTNHNHRGRIAAVPRFPRGIGLKQVQQSGGLRGEPLDWYNRGNKLRQGATSKIYTRIDPDGLFPTILTAPRPTDAIAGRTFHWDQNRHFTVMEARRAQGYPDDEVLVGNTVQQLHIVGNSVDRHASFPLGRGLFESWMGSETRSKAMMMGGSVTLSQGRPRPQEL